MKRTELSTEQFRRIFPELHGRIMSELADPERQECGDFAGFYIEDDGRPGFWFDPSKSGQGGVTPNTWTGTRWEEGDPDEDEDYAYVGFPADSGYSSDVQVYEDLDALWRAYQAGGPRMLLDEGSFKESIRKGATIEEGSWRYFATLLLG